MSAQRERQGTDDRDGGVDNIQKSRKRLDEEYAALTNQETMLQLALRQLEYEEDCLKKGIEAATAASLTTTTTTPTTATTILSGRRRQRFQPSSAASEQRTPTTAKHNTRNDQEQADERLEHALRMQLGDSSSSSDDDEGEEKGV